MSDNNVMIHSPKSNGSSSYNSFSYDSENSYMDYGDGEEERKYVKRKSSTNSVNTDSSSKRQDVVFKTILRQIRKVYLEDFNDTTNYIKVKRY